MSGVWTDENDELLKSMARDGMSLRVISAKFGVSHMSVSKRAKKLGVSFGDLSATVVERAPRRTADHLVNFKRARRGFVVPAHLEPEYYDLLRSGVSIAEACQRLNIKTNE